MSPRTPRSGERGFSLMELMVAMLITVIISGAIYGLILSGQTAFRREPELADRQQNIRIAMDLIQRDVLLAGQGVPWFGQVFSIGDLATTPGACPPAVGLNGCGPAGSGTLGAAAAAARNGDAEETDVLEIVAAEEQCPYFTACGVAGGPVQIENPLNVMEPPDGSALACPQVGAPTLLLAINNFNFTILGAGAAAGPGTCTGANRSFTIVTSPVGSWAAYTSPTPAALVVPAVGAGGAWVAQARIARYEIAPDPTDLAPSLWRSTTGLYNTDGTDAGSAGAGVGTWQLVARGIEDMQVEYLDGGGWANAPGPLAGAPGCGTPNPEPPQCDPAESANIVRQVRVTLSARSMAPNILGAVLDGNQTAGSEALRGQLSAVITPRAAKVGLAIP